MRKGAVLILLFLCYGAVTLPLTRYLQTRPVMVKLGYTPEADILKVIAADHRQTIAEMTMLKVIFYFGSLVEHWEKNVLVRPEYFNMFKTIETTVKLDPYNIDAYYFAQSAFTWEIGHAEDVNRLLEYGMKYRTWDEWLPFYVGFNAAYFLKDYEKAALFMQKAADLSGNLLYTQLAARYFYEAGRTELGVLFLDEMIQRTKDPQVRSLYRIRKQGLLATEEIAAGLRKFRKHFGSDPMSLDELVEKGILLRLPKDPYGGEFYLDEEGRVRTTSKFAQATQIEEDRIEPLTGDQ